MHSYILKTACRISRIHSQADSLGMCFFYIFQHALIGMCYFFFCKQTSQNGNCCATMIIHLIFIKCFRERRTIQIDVWNKFLTLAVPQMFTDIGHQLFFYTLPFLSIGLVYRNFLKVVNCQHQHGIVVNINGIMRIIINRYSPRVFRLYISPVGGSSSCN